MSEVEINILHPLHWHFGDWIRFNKGKNKQLHSCFSCAIVFNPLISFVPSVWLLLGKTNLLEDWQETKTQITTCNRNTTNSPVCRHLNQLPIECSAEGGDNGNERQETPCTVLACQACLEPKHLERKTEKEWERDSGRERGEWEERRGEKSRNENSALYRSNYLLDPYIKTCQLSLNSHSF